MTPARRTTQPAPRTKRAAAPGTPARSGAPASRVTRRATALRGRAEDLAVQADLAAMGVRDELREELAAAENAWLAARGRLDEAAEEAQHAVDDLRGALKKVIADVTGAQQAADAAIRRTRARR